MSSMFWLLLALFVVTDVIVITIVIRRTSPVLRTFTLLGGASGNRILQSAHTIVGDYLHVNYSGDVEALPTALAGLLPQLRDLLRSNGVEPAPEVVRALVEISANKHRIATREQLRAALATIA